MQESIDKRIKVLVNDKRIDRTTIVKYGKENREQLIYTEKKIQRTPLII